MIRVQPITGTPHIGYGDDVSNNRGANGCVRFRLWGEVAGFVVSDVG